MVNHFVRSTNVPDALMALDSVADVGDGAMFVFHDNEVVAANAKAIGLYRSLDWGGKVSFDDCFWYGVKTGRTRDTEILKNPADHLAFAKLHRAWSPSHRFCRRHSDTGVIYDRHHIGLNHVWNAQIWLPVCEGGGIDFAITPETKPYEVRRYLARERALSRLLTFLEGSGTALAIVDATGWLLDSTPAMTRLLVRGDLLRLGTDERLEGLTEEVTGRIRSCLSEISCGRRSASLVPLPSPDGGNILAGIMRSGPTDPSAIIAVATRDGTAELEALLCDAFRLTPAEAAVAMRMADGATAEGIAETTSRSMPTVRSQLAAVKKKTGSGRQHELAVLVAKAAGLVGGSFNLRKN